MIFEISFGWANLVLPFAVLAALAVLVPVTLARVTPETMIGLALNAAISASVLAAVSAAYLVGTYTVAQVPGAFLEGVWGSLRAVIIWGPIAAVVLLQQPSRWRPELE